MTKRRQLSIRNRSGVVLFMVVAIILMMTLLTYGFLISMRTQNLAAANAGNQLQARQAAFSAREIVCSLLEDSLASRFAVGGLEHNPMLFSEIRLLFAGEDREDFSSGGFVLSNLTDRRMGIINESAKINLQTLLSHDANSPGFGRDCLMRLPRMTESIADHILDWIDKDDEPREFGAETEYYRDNNGILPRNATPPTLSEFENIPDVTREMIFGASSQNPNDNQIGQVGEDASIPWSRFLTVRSAERNETYEGLQRAHLNSTDLFELHTSLVELIDVETANFVILARQYGIQSRTKSDNGTGSSSAKSPSGYPIDLTIPPVYEIESLLEIVGATIRIEDVEAPENSIVVASPYSGQTTNLDQRLETFLDETTVSRKLVIQGRVNINLAPLEVLLSVPGIDEELANQILAVREGQKHNSKTCFWLLSNRLVNMEQMKSLIPSITNRGEIASFMFGGWSHPNDAPMVYDAMVDATGKTSKQLFCRRIVETKQINDFFNKSNLDE
ncbi:type II secretion system protein GspK [bacterium]|nr:type II secretion system protein GspK [bacterium]